MELNQAAFAQQQQTFPGAAKTADIIFRSLKLHMYACGDKIVLKLLNMSIWKKHGK